MRNDAAEFSVLYQESPPHMQPCPCCGSRADFYQRYVPGVSSHRIVLCSNTKPIGEQDVNYEDCGCPLSIDNMEHLAKSTLREAVRAWNAFALDMVRLREQNTSKKDA
jgi:hypothetical protein